MSGTLGGLVSMTSGGLYNTYGYILRDEAFNYPRNYTYGLPKGKNYCQQLDLMVVEVDGDCTDIYSSCDESDDEYPGEESFGIFQDDFNQTSVTFSNDDDGDSLETQNLTCFKDRNDMSVCFHIELADEQHYNVAGALTNTSGSLTKSRFGLSSVPLEMHRNVHEYNPIVATNGDSFLTVWEREEESNTNTYSYIHARAFNSSGSGIDGDQLLGWKHSVASSSNRTRSIPPPDALEPYSRGYDAAWTGSYYAVVYHMVGTSDEQIYLSLLDSNGNKKKNYMLASSSSTTKFSTPRIATIPNEDRIAAVYEQDGNIKLRIGTIDGTSISWSSVKSVGSGSDHDVAYEAQSQSWVVGYNYSQDFSSLLMSQAPAAPAAGASGASTTSTASAASTTANTRTHIINPALLHMLFVVTLLLAGGLFVAQELSRRRGGNLRLQRWLRGGASSSLLVCLVILVAACDSGTTTTVTRYYRVYDLSGNLIDSVSFTDIDETNLALACPDADTAPPPPAPIAHRRAWWASGRWAARPCRRRGSTSTARTTNLP